MFERTATLFATLIVCYALGQQTRSYNGYKVLDIKPAYLADLDLLHTLSNTMDFWYMPRNLNDSAHVLVGPNDMQEFTKLLDDNKMAYSTLIDDVNDTFGMNQELTPSLVSRSNVQKGISFDEYARFATIDRYLEELAVAHPKLVKVVSVGVSYERRNIKVIRITDRTSGGAKKSVFLDAGIHAREWIAPATALYVIHELVENYANNRDVLKNLEWIILPLANPDGYEYSHTTDRMWRKTRSATQSSCRGTDANRNFGFHWGEVGASANGCSDTFRGATAFSEPETIVMRNIMETVKKHCKFYLTLHSYGNYMLYPWGYTSKLPSTWKDIHEVATAGAEAIRKATGTIYTVGSSTNVLYAAAGGSDDYALGVKKIPVSITMELPGGGSAGFNPPPSKILSMAKESWMGIKAMALKVDQKYSQQ